MSKVGIEWLNQEKKRLKMVKNRKISPQKIDKMEMKWHNRPDAGRSPRTGEV